VAADLRPITNVNGTLKLPCGTPFQFHSFNAPELTLAKTTFEVDDALETFAQFKNPVTRLMVLVGKRLMTKCGQYNENELRLWDYIIARANALGVRLIIPLVNGKQNKYYGPYTYFGRICQNDATDDGFYKKSRADFLSVVTMALNRYNTVSGLRWGDDPAIMAIETGNELGSWNDVPPPADWTLEVAALVKKLAPKALFIDGTLIGGARNRWPVSVLSSPNVDIFSDHFYRMCSTPDPTCLKDSTAFVKNYRKAFIAGEWGFDLTTIDQFFQAASEAGTAGTLIWSMRSRHYLGGFYTHTETDGPSSWHLPGWDRCQAAWTSTEGTVISQKFITPLTGGDFPNPTTPPALINTTDGKLIWQGSAWADHYEILRVNRGVDTIVTKFAYDAVANGAASLYEDVNAPAGSTYRIRGVGKNGGRTAWSSANVILKANGASCKDSSECLQSCCSSKTCAAGFTNCEKWNFGQITKPPGITTSKVGNPATSTTAAPTATAAPTVGDWNFCTTSEECINNCCSNEWSDDGKYKCTPGGGDCL